MLRVIQKNIFKPQGIKATPVVYVFLTAIICDETVVLLLV